MGEVWVTVAFLERHYGLSRSHVYKLASVNQWRKRRDGHAVEYLGCDVWITLEALRSRIRSGKV